tara:strand:+ start:4302 stop:5387 length:1086 start_codon:yes stop_codon:yes gene_type:complete
MIKKTNLFCILPSYINHEGHEASFVQCYQKLKNNNVFFIVPKTNRVKNSPPFCKVLKNKKSDFYFTKIVQEILFFFLNISSINKVIEQKGKNQKNIVYLDGASIFILLSIFFLHNKKKIFFIYYIRSIYYKHTRDCLLFLIMKSFRFFFYKFKIVTDSLKLKKYIEKKITEKLTVLPIPHTNFKKITKFTNFSKINIFCPGAFRKDKYGNNFNLFLKKNDDVKYNLIVSKNFINKNKKTKTTYFNNLDKQNYFKTFAKSDFVLLPYEKKEYSLKTSGIFVESIVFGKIPIVTAGTWMSEELSAYNLNDLIVINWNDFELSALIKKVKNNLFYKKFKNMQNIYYNLHNQRNFINKFSEIVEK